MAGTDTTEPSSADADHRAPRPEKVAVVAEVKAKLAEADATILTEYRGLDVGALAVLRRQLREVGGEYKIYKNTLVRIAARDLGLDLDDALTGPTAVTFVQGDAVAVAKALRDYSRTNPILVVKGGLLGEKVLTADDTRALADVAPREVLLAQLAGAMAAPMQQFAGLLQALPRNFAYALQALIDKNGGAPEAPAPEETPAAAEPEVPAAETTEDDTTEDDTTEDDTTEDDTTEDDTTDDTPVAEDAAKTEEN